MSRQHWIKCEEPYLTDIISGDKPFEIRINDRGYQKGDLLFLRRPLDPEQSWRATAVVSYVLSGFGLKEDWVALGLNLRVWR